MTKFLIPTGLLDEMISSYLPKSTEPPLSGLNTWLTAALSQEPDPEDITQRGPVTRWIGYAFGNPRMSKTDALAVLPLEPGDPNPFFPVIDAISREGAIISPANRMEVNAIVDPVVREIWQLPQYAIALVMTGGDAIGMPVWFEIDDITAPCPFSDSDPQETWETWGDYNSGHKPKKLGDKWYRSNAVGASGTKLNASVFIGAGVPILSRIEYMAIKAAHTPAMPVG